MKSPRSGQSIIEAMVAISILTVGLLGILTLLTKSFQLTRVVDDQTTGTYLASEGIEVAKSLIDHDIYSGAGWSNCFPFSAPFQVYVKLDYQSYDCSNGSLDPSFTFQSFPIYFDPTTKLYTETNLGGMGMQTIFSRAIAISAPVNGNELDVQSTVSWTSDLGTPQSITVEDHFYNWHP